MTVDYINNTNQRTPCVLVLDASYSMSTNTPSGKTRIKLLNEGESTGRRTESGSNCTYSSSDKHCDCRRA